MPKPDPQTKSAEQERREREQTVASRVAVLWASAAIHWPAKYRNAIEACLDAEADFDRASIHRSGK